MNQGTEQNKVKKNDIFLALQTFVCVLLFFSTLSLITGCKVYSFTGASIRRIGKFEEADGGSLFLDEIGEMELNLQVKLLRVLQEKEIVRIGSNTAVKTDCRIIVATNKNLKEEVKKGKFREDLYYRLLGLPIELPPLRDRGNDILILAHHFIENFCTENNIRLKKLSEKSQMKLLSYSFPGRLKAEINKRIVGSRRERRRRQNEQ